MNKKERRERVQELRTAARYILDDRNAAAAQGNTSGANAAQREADKNSNATCLPIVLAIVCLAGLFLLAGAGAGLGF